MSASKRRSAFASAAIAVFVLASAVGVGVAKAETRAKIDERLTSAKEVLAKIKSDPSGGLPQEIEQSAACVVVVPGYTKAAFVVGGQYGKGFATCRTNKGWSAPLVVQLNGGSYGFQIGGQVDDIIVIGVNEHSLTDLLSGKFKLSGDVTAMPGVVGTHTDALKTAPAGLDFVTYIYSKGALSGASLDGTVISHDVEANRTLYGTSVSSQDVISGKVPTPVDAKPFVYKVEQMFVHAPPPLQRPHIEIPRLKN